MKKYSAFKIEGILGQSGSCSVFLGIAPAKLLRQVSFADVLDEDSGEGYQRPYSRAHSADFRSYILRPGSSTPPLIFNLRDEFKGKWRLESTSGALACLFITQNEKCLVQVDCQHRLGELGDCDVPLAFMAYIGLSLRQEMAIFNVINSKAKGLSSSLTDYHESKLLDDLSAEAPHLFIGRRLNEDPASPWFRMIRYGGEMTSGLKRRTSFRMMQKSIATFLSSVRGCDLGNLENRYIIVRSYWQAVRDTFPEEWADHRHHLLSKGVGLYSLMQLLADIVRKNPRADFSIYYFTQVLSPLAGTFDWSSGGRFAYVGGRKGVQDVYLALRKQVGQ